MTEYSLEYTPVAISFGESSSTEIPANTFFISEIVNYNSSSSRVVCLPIDNNYYDVYFELGGAVQINLSLVFDASLYSSLGYSLFNFNCNNPSYTILISAAASSKIVELVIAKNSSGVGSVIPFNYLDLNGNCGTFKNDTIVNVAGKTGDYIVKSSQFVWDDTTKKSSMVIYNLEKDGTLMLAPDVLVSLKVVP